ncbi:response regulator transcription factor [Gaiella sp.]|uniref:response regulator transcription factor n=1 Tax=Gaiella sp. TaxID=2663207 RepID=UPI003266A39A
MNRNVVVIDDEQSVRDVVRGYLENDGFVVFTAENGREGLALTARVRPALVVLDLMLPDVSGEEICRDIRTRSDVPILMLTARASEDNRVDGLRLGADDYLTKPFSPRELVARVHAVLRRTRGADVPLVEVLSFGERELEIDTVQHEIRCDGIVVDLTPNEYKLLVTLARFPGRVYTRYELVTHVQGIDFDGDERTIDAHVKNLRKKIEPDPRRPRYVLTVVGSGYRLAKAHGR